MMFAHTVQNIAVLDLEGRSHVHLKAHETFRHDVLRILVNGRADKLPIQNLDHDRPPRDDVVLVPAAHVYYSPKQRRVADGGHGFVFRSVGDAGQLPSRRESTWPGLRPRSSCRLPVYPFVKSISAWYPLRTHFPTLGSSTLRY